MVEGARREQLSLEAAVTHILEECRMVLPGIQALFGFQLVAVFSYGFSQSLSKLDQQLHFFSIAFTVISIGLVMAPAAVHRTVDPFSVSEAFIRLSTRLLLSSLLPLAISISIEIFLIGKLIMDGWLVGITSGLLAFILFLSLWVGLPLIQRRERGRQV